MKKFLIGFFKVIGFIVLSIGICVFSAFRIQAFDRDNNIEKYKKIAAKKIANEISKEVENTIILINAEKPVKTRQKLNDWRLVLVNFENTLPEDFEVELANVDQTRQFDKRAIDELNALLQDAKKAKIGNLWVQSAYRSVEKQEELFNNKVEEYKRYGKTDEEAEELTKRYINKSNTSEHNLGLAVDFNYIKTDFENSPAFTWLNENAVKYGFVLRYRQDKEEITGVSYEPWHWRYVGVEHAEKMNELDMCLEEYVEYLEENN